VTSVMTSVDRSLRTAIAAFAFGLLPATGGIAMAGSLGGPLQPGLRRDYGLSGTACGAGSGDGSGC
jgi:hypothetical protein